MAVTEAMSRGTIEVIVRSINNTSMTKVTPAIGALKMPPTAPAAPQPTRSMSVRWSSLKNCPRLEPMAEPVSTIGASAPTEPPNPMVILDATIDDQQLWSFMIALCCEIA